MTRGKEASAAPRNDTEEAPRNDGTNATNAINSTNAMNTTNSKRGFTLVEILAAIAIISFGIAPIVSLLPEGMKSLRKVERTTMDVLLAQYKMDEVRSQILGLNASYGFDKSGGYDGSGTFTLNPDYAYSVTDDMGADIKEISVTVWMDENGNGSFDTGEEYVTLDTKVAKR
jgi:prepilin-type N-terminal cleavage/methylation domain-containing protein